MGSRVVIVAIGVESPMGIVIVVTEVVLGNIEVLVATLG